MEDRLQKIIAAAGVASRRQAEALILSGVVQVNGKVVRELGTKANLDRDEVSVNGIGLKKPEAFVTYLLNKPFDVVCSKSQQGQAKIVTDFVPKLPSVHPVGRLDKESVGLILLTNDGTLTHKLTHPSFEHSKEYTVRMLWKNIGSTEPSMSELVAKLYSGVKLSDGKVVADKVQLKSDKQQKILVITVHEGRHHLVRRMCAVLGYKVLHLERTAIGKLRDANLKPGAFRKLSVPELALL